MTATSGRPIAETEREAPSGEHRVSTGNANLDTILNGGLVAGRPYLVVGPSGTGKTKLALQFLCDGVRRGERVLLITLEDPPNEMRVNHRALEPDLDQVHIFDAIPDVMRYERAPFKDIAAVRSSVKFSEVGPSIRKTAELVSVEVTFSALEQTLKMEMVKRNFTRLVVDSLTALQYFCMKGIDETLGAQTFLRFLSDQRVTTLLTVESPVEEVETAERLLARGEIRLFRWELEGRTVRAIGVEKFRGSAHDVRLHPYRISGSGLDIDIQSTVSRDTRRVIDPTEEGAATPSDDSLSVRPTEVGQILADMSDLAALGIDVRPVEGEIVAMRAAGEARKGDEVALHLLRARAFVSELAQQWNPRIGTADEVANVEIANRVTRIADEAGEIRAGKAPGERAEEAIAAPVVTAGPPPPPEAAAVATAPARPPVLELLPPPPPLPPSPPIPAVVEAPHLEPVEVPAPVEPVASSPGVAERVPATPAPAPEPSVEAPPLEPARARSPEPVPEAPATPAPVLPEETPTSVPMARSPPLPVPAPPPPAVDFDRASPSSDADPTRSPTPTAEPEAPTVRRGSRAARSRPPLPEGPMRPRARDGPEPPAPPAAPSVPPVPPPTAPVREAPRDVVLPGPTAESSDTGAPVGPSADPPAAPVKKAAPRRRKKVEPATDGVSTPSPPRRRASSRRKAPPVTGAESGTPPPEATPAPEAPAGDPSSAANPSAPGGAAP